MIPAGKDEPRVREEFSILGNNILPLLEASRNYKCVSNRQPRREIWIRYPWDSWRKRDGALGIL